MSTSGIELAGYEKIGGNGFPRRNRGRLIIGGLIFLLLTLAIFGFQFYRIQTGDEIPSLDQLRWGYLILIVCFLPMEALALGLRMWVVCRVLQPGISYWTCFRADLANSGIALLTPSQSGGGAGQIYFLNRGGALIGTALTTTLLTFLGTMLALLGFGLYSPVLFPHRGYGPFFHGGGHNFCPGKRLPDLLGGMARFFPRWDRRRLPVHLASPQETISSA